MPNPAHTVQVQVQVKVFVSYSHKDPEYLEDDSLLGYLKGLEKENVEFWTDRDIRTGELWDAVVKANIQEAHIALVLVSQGFLDSDYCQKEEITRFLAQKSHLFPIILSPCEWQRHEWLHRRQFLPGGDETIEEHYNDPGRRKRLFLEIRQQLRERIELIRQTPAETTHGSTSAQPATLPPTRSSYSGRTKVIFLQRLGERLSGARCLRET